MNSNLSYNVCEFRLVHYGMPEVYRTRHRAGHNAASAVVALARVHYYGMLTFFSAGNENIYLADGCASCAAYAFFFIEYEGFYGAIYFPDGKFNLLHKSFPPPSYIRRFAFHTQF